jgi:hypothetical protein
MKIDLTKKELKLIKKALNRKLGKDEEKTRDSIYDKIETSEKIINSNIIIIR